MKRLLLFSYFDRHLKKVLPLVDRLRETPGVETHVVVYSEEQRLRMAALVPDVRSLQSFTKAAPRSEFDLSWALEVLMEVLALLKPETFVCMEVNYILRNAVRYCRDQGIRTVVIQHGTPNRFSAHAFVPFEADLFLAWGRHTRDFLLPLGFPPERLKLTGGVNFDSLTTGPADRAEIASALGLDPAKRWVLFTAQGTGAGGMPTPVEIQTGVQAVCRHMKDRPGYDLIVQPHPSQDRAVLESLVAGAGNESVVVSLYRDTEVMIRECFALVTFFSTTALDAVMRGKPLLLITLSDDRDFFPFVEMEVALGVYEEAEIVPQLDRILGGWSPDPAHSKAASEYVNEYNDGKAADRVLAALLEKEST